ncbi:MAG: TIGR01620 family protein [Pseudomonadota bacterium]
MTRKPIAFDLDALSEPAAGGSSRPSSKKTSSKGARKPRAEVNPVLEPIEDPFAYSATDEVSVEELEPNVAKLRLKGLTFGKLFFGAVGLLVSLALGLWIDGLVRTLLETWPPLGWFALGLTALALVIAIGFALREIWALKRLARMDVLRQAVADARTNADGSAAMAAVDQVAALYKSRPETASGRGEVEAHRNDIMSADIRLDVAERALMRLLDMEAQRLVTRSSARVAMVTAVSPRALVDVGYVLFENLRLIRRIAELYGLRPGLFGSVRLTAAVVSHLAVTGTIAVGDGILHQAIGTGVAARLSARFGEGVVNGLLTARIGISASDLCRPMPFHALPRPKISDFVNPITALTSKNQNGSAE